MQDKILELERKITEDKKLLNDMSKTVYEGYAYNADFIKAKLNNMQSDIEYMEQQMIILKRDVEAGVNTQVQKSTQPVVSTEQIQVHQMSPVIHQTPQQGDMSTGWQGQNMSAIGQQQVQDSMYVQQYQPITPPPKPKDMEAAVGKTIMGIAASVLIFISFILFAMLIIPQLTDGIRLVLMYAVSIGITTFGLLKLNKTRDSVLFLSVSACGVGSIFISLFLSNIYFHVINEFVLYILLLCWAAGVCVLSKLRSEVFSIIGHIGILVSVFFGTIFCAEGGDINKMVVISIYFIVGSLIFYFTHNSNQKNYIINSIFNLICVYILYAGIQSVHWDYQVDDLDAPGIYFVAFGILMTYSIFKLILPVFWSGLDKETSRFTLLQKYADATGMISAGYYFAFSLLLDGLVSDELMVFVIMLITAPVYLFIIEYVRRNYTEAAGINVLYSFLTLMMIFSVYNLSGVEIVFGVSIIAIPYIIYGFVKNKRIFKYLAIFLMFLFVVNEGTNLAMTIILGLIMLGGTMYFILTKKEQYKQVLKNIVLVLSLIFVICIMNRIYYDLDVESVTTSCIEFIILSVIAGVAAKTKYIQNPITGVVEKETKIFVDIIIACLMFAGMGGISSAGEDYLLPHIIYIIITIALFMLNASEQLKDEERKMYGPYVGLKFTVLMVVILSSFNAENFLISIFCFLFAILSVTVGFIVKHKGLRIYGLILSLISVVKLVMIDITYDNTLGHALSFFISGVLCFVISAIYTHVEKKMQDGEQTS